MTANNLVNLKSPKGRGKAGKRMGFPPHDKGKREAVKRRRKTRGWLFRYWNNYSKSRLFKLFISQWKRQKIPTISKKRLFFLAYLHSNVELFN